MADRKTVDILGAINSQNIKPHNILVGVLTGLLLLIDGYDFVAPGFAAPMLVRDWGIKNFSSLGPLFSASIIGVLVGAPIAGFLADRFGRRVVLVGGAALFGVFSLAVCLATDVNQLIILRFFAGTGLGGVMPVAIALNSEYAPKKLKAKIVCIVLVGLSIGTGCPGPVAAWLAPIYGWKVIFFVGGILPIFLAAVLYFFLPESPTYLALNKPTSLELAKIIKWINPDISISRETNFIIGDEELRTNAKPSDLFKSRYKYLTPVIWILFFVLILVQYSIQAWSPTVLASAGIPMSHAVLGTTVFQIGACVGGLIMGYSVDKFGATPVTICTLLSIPVIGFIGLNGLSETTIMMSLFVAGVLVIGAQSGMDSLVSMIYPSFIKANGIGFALGVGRLGAIFGAMIGGYLISLQFSMQSLFLLLSGPLIIAFLACVTLSRHARLTSDSAKGAVTSGFAKIGPSEVQTG